MRHAIVRLAIVVCFGAPMAAAQQTESTAAVPSVITGGSSDVTLGGMPAARSGDATDRGDALAEGSSNVFINGRPAVTLGDRTGCGGLTVGGASNVFINGKPVARSGDMTTGCSEK
jgi:uncharacterized Zn-binding protein involved in type VI secretion